MNFKSIISLLPCIVMELTLHAETRSVPPPLVVYGVDYPPYISTDPSAPGLLNELIDTGAKLIGAKLEFRSVPLKRAIVTFAKDENSVLLESREVIPPEILQNVSVFPLMSVDNLLMVRTDFPAPVPGQDRHKRLSGLTGAILSGAEDELNFAKSVGAKTIVSQSLNQSLTMLLKGRVDFLICVTLTCVQALNKNPAHSKLLRIENESIYSFSIDILVHKTNSKNQTLVKSLLKKLYLSESYGKIIKSHYKQIPTNPDYDRLIKSNL